MRKSSVETCIHWKTVLGFWGLLAVFNTLPNLILRGWSEGTYTYPRHLAGNMILGACCAALTPALLWLSKRLPVHGHRAVLHLLAHVAGAFVFSLLVILLYLVSTARLFEHPSMPIEEQVRYMGRLFFNQLMTAYWIVVLVHHVLTYADRLHDEQLAASQMKELLTSARLESLRARLRPHFLFNSLHTIGSLVRLEKKHAALDTLEQLGDLLRLSLTYGGDELVPLERELEFVEKYLNVERQRFPDRLRVTYEISPEARLAQIPSLLLQPIVENAIKHGIGKLRDAGALHLMARREGDWLRLEVRDDGPGLPREGSAAQRTGTGIRNTRERLDELFSNQYLLELNNVEPRGLAVALRIPWRGDEGNG